MYVHFFSVVTLENQEGFPFNIVIIGRILGPAKGEGNKMAQWVLKANGIVTLRRTTRPLKTENNMTLLKQRNCQCLMP